MSTTHVATPTPAPSPPVSPYRRLLGVLVIAVALLVMFALSIAIGARPLTSHEVWQGLFHATSESYSVVHESRLPRSIMALLAGLALGLAGALMQTLTRNPLADPGILGINAGAAAAVVSATAFLGIANFSGFVWFALAGAGGVGALVYLVGGGRGATPARLALSGAALNAALFSYVNAVQLVDTASLARMRFWTVGSLSSADFATINRVLPFIIAGTLVAALTARPLNALALGEESAKALGTNPWVTRAAVLAAITVLCGAATAACGPLVFIGLMVPHLVRPLTGPNMGWMLPYCALGAPALLLAADVFGRWIASPSELQVGIVTAIVGGPFFLYFVRRDRQVQA